MKPLIGVNLDIEIEPGRPPLASVQITYYKAVQEAGGIPVMLAPMPDADLDMLLARLNGILLIGGLDYSPEHYGEPISETCKLLNPLREEFDLRLVDRTVNRTKLPLLGICGGEQLLNISMGGKLIQDIKSEHPHSDVVHTTTNGWTEGFTQHLVRLEPASLLHEIYGVEELDVPTSHHQAVKTLGKGLKATAYAGDGIIEAIEMPERPFTVGVQWHPERDYQGNRRLFREFIKQSESRRNGKSG